MKAQTEEYMYSSTLSLTSAIDGVGGQCHASTSTVDTGTMGVDKSRPYRDSIPGPQGIIIPNCTCNSRH